VSVKGMLTLWGGKTGALAKPSWASLPGGLPLTVALRKEPPICVVTKERTVTAPECRRVGVGSVGKAV